MRSQTIDTTRLKIVNGKVFIKPLFEPDTKVGYITNGRLIVTCKDNYHKASKSLGIDKEIIWSKLLNFTQIQFKFHGYKYVTTRRYFADYSFRQSLMNGRNMVFMKIKTIDLAKGLDYDSRLRDAQTYKFSIPRNLKDMDIFDVFEAQRHRGITNNQLFKRWEQIIQRPIKKDK